MYRSNVNNIPVPDSTGATSSCNSHIINSTESDINIFAYYDPGVNFTDGTSLNMPTGVNFQISANNSFPNDTLTTLSSYPFMILVDQDLVTSLSNDPNSKSINSYAADTSNLFVLSPYQRQVVWFDRVKYSQLDAASRKGVLSVTKQSAKLAFNYFSLSTRIRKQINFHFTPLNPLGVNPSLFTATLEIYNQSSTLTTYKETDKASQFKVLTFLTSLGGANAFFVTFYMFLYDQPPHMRDVEKEVDNIP
ncbi:39237_t:CDS:2 [Gigaspora margarita]|uniref:39237_t:CDS:1 n=1 Tax=Gigaspora margarita TaxID=4874 RepID=A0ABN7VMP2_GIGMA|nr:39237_t:CDS:2 [Gigaspora margarita]